MRLFPVFLLGLLLPGVAPAAPVKDAFERITPAEAGYSEEKLGELRDFLQTTGTDSLLLLHEGKVFFEWGDIRKKLLLHSMRKCLLNSLYGIAEAEGRMNLDDDLGELDIQDIAPALTAAEKRATVRDLLESRSGVYHLAAAEAESMERARPGRGSHPPGTYYYYNNWDFNVAGRIYERRTGQRIYDAFEARIARPLGMLDYHARVVVAPTGEKPVDPDADGYYQYERERSDFPAYHFRMSAHDLALYGQLYLQHGQWKGKQIVPAEWIDRSTQPRSIVDEQYGLAYGMLWDVLVPEPGEARPSFFHTGVGVHMLGAYPKHGLVMVHRVDTERESRFDEASLYQIIRRIHGARLSKRPN